MRKSIIYRLALLVAVMLPLALASCKKDDPNPDNGTPVKPSTEISDPEGTITLSMRNADSGKTYLDNQFYIDNENFTGGYFVSLGEVKGLGNVSTIPLKGWSSQVAVIPGNGYVAYNPSNSTFYRIYVVQEIVSTTGGIIGAEIKYQKAFKGSDDTLSLLTTIASISSFGESSEVLFSNTNLVPFTATSTEAWCHVETCSSYDYSFITNGVSISCDENLDTQPRSATVTLTTGYGKTATIAVTQSGSAPFVSVNIDNLQSLPFAGGTVDVNFGTNMDANSFIVSGAPDWLTAEVNVVNITSRVRYIGKRAVTKQTATQYGYIRLTAQPNTGDERTASISIKSKDGKATDNFSINQDGAWLVAAQMSDEYYIKYDPSTITIKIRSNLDYEDLNISSSDWIKINLSDREYYTGDLDAMHRGPFYELTLRLSVEENAEAINRTGFVKIQAGSIILGTMIVQIDEIPELDPQYWQYIYIIGQPQGWDINSDALSIVDRTGKGIYTGTITLANGTENYFRFYTALGDWESNSIGYQEPDVGTDITGLFVDGVYEGAAVEGKGSWGITTDGTYGIEFDLHQMTVKFTRQ